jgi:hypothetical protein
MHLAQYQSRSKIFCWCEQDDLQKLPTPTHITDVHTGWLLVEFENNIPNQVALRLCGLKPYCGWNDGKP